MLDISATTAPRSDQQNFDDYIAGDKTVTISDVRAGSDEQPVELHLAEFPGRPYKPSKSMRRVLLAAWGSDASTYVGRRMTLYGDPTVKFGGATTGGIKISHLSHIQKPLNLSLTATRGKRAPHTVQPLPDAPSTAPAPLLADLRARMADAGIISKPDALAYLSRVAGRAVKNSRELTTAEAQAVIDALGQPADPSPGDHVDVATGEVHDAPAVEDPPAELWPETPEVKP